MKIKYADHHKWVKELSSEDNFSSFGDSNREKLKSTLNKINETKISSIIRPISEEFLLWFLPMYIENIAKKDNPKVFPIREKVLQGGKEYFSFELYEDDIPIGGTIFSKKENTVSIAYRVFLNNWRTVQLRANPSLYTEYLLEQYTRTQGAEMVVHGRDRNPYGLNSGIGLALFKLAMGCRPHLSRSYELFELDTESCSTDVFVFEYPTIEDGLINKGYLITAKDTLGKWLPVTKYPHLVDVEVIFRD